MNNILLLVEGSTEKNFSSDFLSLNFPENNFLPLLLLEGGYHSFHKTVKEVNLKIKAFSHYNKIILVYDYYGLHPTFKEGVNSEWALAKKIEFIREKFIKEIYSEKFYFYIQVHEFEACLFSDIDILDNHFGLNKKKELETILAIASNNPELINDSSTTSPAKRLENLFPNFGKTTDGIAIINKIGINKIREKCSYFNEFCREIEK